MRHARTVSIFVVIAVVTVVTPTWSRDVIERPAAIAPGSAPNGFTLFPALYAEAAYDNYAFRAGENDSFQIRNTVHFGIVDVARTRLGLYYGTYLFSGPVDDPEKLGSDLAPWLMNAVQFEYGVSSTVAAGRFNIVADYGRRSYHPLRRGFADPASDIIRFGGVVRDYAVAAGTIDAAMRVRWSQLFKLWGTDIDQPDTVWAVQPAMEYRLPLSESPYRRRQVATAFFVSLGADVPLIGDRPGDPDISGQMGFSIGNAPSGDGIGSTAASEAPVANERLHRGIPGRIEAYLDLYRSPDTEELPDEAAPVTLIGLGVRFVFEM